MNLEITGKFVKTLPEQSGTSAKGAWRKGGFVIETEEQFPRKIAIMCWNEKIDEANSYMQGDKMKVYIDVESREWQDKWFTDIKAWRIERLSDQNSQQTQPANNFGPVSTQAQQADSFAPFTSNDMGNDDLPF